MQLDKEYLDMAIEFATSAAGGLALLVGGFIVGGWMKSLVLRIANKRGFDQTISIFLGNMARYAIVALTVLSCLSVFGIETTSFAAVIGAMGLAVGLALQGSLSNVASGVMLVGFRPFKVGDVISTCGHTGKVEEISLFTTTMLTPDNRRLIVPNGAVFGGTIENITAMPTRRVEVVVGVDYDADLKKTREVLESTYQGMGLVLQDPAPQVVLAELGASSVDWKVRVWCNTGDFFAVLEELTENVKNKLDEAQIGIPYPQMDVHLDKVA